MLVQASPEVFVIVYEYFVVSLDLPRRIDTHPVESSSRAYILGIVCSKAGVDFVLGVPRIIHVSPFKVLYICCIQEEILVHLHSIAALMPSVTFRFCQWITTVS